MALLIALAMALSQPAHAAKIPENARSRKAHAAVMGTPAHPGPLARELRAQGFHDGSRMVIRIFKQRVAPDPSLNPSGAGTLEVWLENKGGLYQLFKTYPIDNYSGFLGPKLKEGDHQTPEGFYRITPELLKPDSAFHLAMDVGFPNAYDRSHGRTGSVIMIHGTGLSVGCYAMTDATIDEIYTLAADALAAGESEIPVLAFPFPLTDANLAAVPSDGRWLSFWLNLREGYDFFELRQKPPVVSVRDGRYAFD